MNDTQIIQLYLDRSETAIQQTSIKYGFYLNQIAFNILRCPEDTEEIVNDTYLAAWNAIPPAVPSVLKHFLSRITRNLAFTRLDYVTAKRRDMHMVILLSELDDCLPDRRGSAEDIWETKEIGMVLNRFLQTLERTDCRLFLSRYYYSMTIEEIAKRHGMPERTVKYRLSRLRKQLRIYLTKEGVVI